MWFDYTDREVDPLPGVPDSDRVWEPLITVRVGGPQSIQLVRGLVDTGSSLTLLPMRYMARLGAASQGETDLSSAGSGYKARLARDDLELRSGRSSYHWSALVGFATRRDRALWGHTGFLEHFLAMFNTHGKHLTLKPNGTFPDPIHLGG